MVFTHRLLQILVAALILFPLAAYRRYGTREELAVLMKLIKKMERGENVIFTKFGDGEYECMALKNGKNCDGDTYHAWLAGRLATALISLAKKPNVFIAKWWEPDASQYCDRLAREHQVTIPWVCYHTIMNGDEFLSYPYMRRLVASLVKTNRKKILVCNTMNSRLKDFFRADVLIEIPAQNWSYDYEKWRDTLLQHVEKDCIVMISAGLCSKVLIDDITNVCQLTCLDLGSAFDMLGRKQNTRCRNHTYEDELRYYKDFIPQHWD